jgi:hypothetical protein
VFENGVLRKLFWPKREEVAGGSILLHFEELHLYSSQHYSGKEMGGACGTCGGEKRCIKGFDRETHHLEDQDVDELH